MSSPCKTESDIVGELMECLGEPFRAYRSQWNLVNEFKLETNFPLFLHIEPNYHCNFKCPMCTQGIPELKKKFGYPEKLNTADIKRIIDEASNFGCPSISFQGDNEPFLVKDIVSWFEMARDAGFQDIMVNTNGSVMNRRMAERIVKSGLTRLRFSLDAVSDEVYRKIRVGGDFAKVKANIELFLAVRAELGQKLPKVGVNCVRLAVNKHEIEPFMEYWGCKVDFVVIQDFMTPDVEESFGYMDVADREAVSNFRCQQPWQRLYIRGNGDVTPCCAMFSSYLKLGNFREQSLADLWNSPAARSLRRLHAEGRYRENPVCLKCSKSGSAGPETT